MSDLGIPFVSSSLKKLNAIKTIDAIPCYQGGLWIEITTGYKAAGLALVEVLTFGCRDLLSFRAGKLPYCGMLVKPVSGRAIPGSDKTWFKKIFKVIDPIEKTFFKFFIVDVGLNFVANWMSLIYQANNCIDRNDTYTATGENALGGRITPGAPFRIVYRKTSETGRGFLFRGSQFVVPAGWYFKCSFDYKIKQYQNLPLGSLDIWLALGSLPTDGEHVCTYDPSSWFGLNKADCGFNGHNNSESARAYTFNGQLHNGYGLPDGGDCSVQISRYPIVNTHLSGLSCLGKSISLLDPYQ